MGVDRDGVSQTIFDSEVKLFLKQGISSQQLGRGWTHLFDLNAIIQRCGTVIINFLWKMFTSQYFKIITENYVSSRYVFSCVICFRFIHFILFSTGTFSLLLVNISSKSNKNWLWNNIFKNCGFIWNISCIVKNYIDRILLARLCTCRIYSIRRVMGFRIIIDFPI